MVNVLPTLDSFITIAEKELRKENRKVVIPMWCEIISDLQTPVLAFYKLCKEDQYAFLLESVDGGETLGRYSVIGFNPLYTLKTLHDKTIITNMFTKEVEEASADPYEAVKQLMKEVDLVDEDRPYFSGGAIGYFSFDSVRHIEPVLNNQYAQVEKCDTFPEAFYIVAHDIVVFDHVKQKIYILNNVVIDENSALEEVYAKTKENIKNTVLKLESPIAAPVLRLNDNPKPLTPSSNFTKEEWNDIINKAIDYIKAGDIFQVVLSQRFELKKPDVDNFMIYRALRSVNPSPYMYYLNFDTFQIVGSSPEMLVKCSKEKKVNTHPIAGTRKRGKNAEEDRYLAEDLLADPKERAEHIMLVDLARNDLGRVCDYGSVQLARFMEIEKYSHVMHIVSDVTGQLKEEANILDTLKACFPAGTLSGAPKVRAMEIIYELENASRGPYGGCVGFIGFNNELNTAITIRTFLIRENKLFVQAGAGIVADSQPDKEYEECVNKANALVKTISLLMS